MTATLRPASAQVLSSFLHLKPRGERPGPVITGDRWTGCIYWIRWILYPFVSSCAQPLKDTQYDYVGNQVARNMHIFVACPFFLTIGVVSLSEANISCDMRGLRASMYAYYV